MGIEHVYTISAGAAPAGINTGSHRMVPACSPHAAEDEGGSLSEHCWFHRVHAGWKGLTASYILTVPLRGTSTHDIEIVGQ